MNEINPKIIIITGSIGTGKSAASKIIKKYGFSVLDSDEIVHEGYKPDNDLHKKVVECFGEEILNEFGEIDRQKLGKIVFYDEQKLNKLNGIVHSFVVHELIKGVEECLNKSKNAVFLDIPLFFEGKDNLIKYGLRYDEVWLVYVNSSLQRERLKKRAVIENKNVEDVLNIIKKQIPIENKKTISHEIIYNEGTLEEFNNTIENLLKKKGLI